MRRSLVLILVTLLSALVLAAGCSRQDPTLSGQITLSRKVSRKTGRPIGEGDTFSPAAKSYVHGLVDFTGVSPNRTYVLHLVWVRPDGKDLFSKYAEVVQEKTSDSQVRTIITWLDAEDLHKIQRDTLNSVEGEFRLDSRLNISTSRNRTPGPHQLRVYLDRRFLMAKDFVVTGELAPES